MVCTCNSFLVGDFSIILIFIVVTTVVAGDVVCGKCFVKFKEDITEDIDSYFSNKPNQFYFIEVGHTESHIDIGMLYRLIVLILKSLKTLQYMLGTRGKER